MNSTLFVADLNQFIGTIFLAAAALLPIINPLGGAPIYLAKTVDLTAEQHAVLSKRVAVNCPVGRRLPRGTNPLL